MKVQGLGPISFGPTIALVLGGPFLLLRKHVRATLGSPNSSSLCSKLVKVCCQDLVRPLDLSCVGAVDDWEVAGLTVHVPFPDLALGAKQALTQDVARESRSPLPEAAVASGTSLRMPATTLSSFAGGQRSIHGGFPKALDSS